MLFGTFIHILTSLIRDFCTSDRNFASTFFQIPPHDGHPWSWLVVGHCDYNPHNRLSLSRYMPCPAYQKKIGAQYTPIFVHHLSAYFSQQKFQLIDHFIRYIVLYKTELLTQSIRVNTLPYSLNTVLASSTSLRHLTRPSV